MRNTVLVFLAVFLLSATSVFGRGDLCQDAKETPSMTRVQIEQFFNDSLKGNNYSGKGVVRDVRSYGSDYIVVVDCLNDVLANVVVSSSSAKDLKVGQEVEFSGSCNHTFRRTYRDTQRTYQLFELQDGDIR